MADDDNAAAPFLSYWQAGYEGADHVTHAGLALDMNRTTGHLDRVAEDYALLHQFGIRTVRESIGWRLAERDGRFDFSSLRQRASIARDLGLQICWTFCHYGWPDDVDLFSPQFAPRFARFCRAAAEYLAPFSGAAPIYSPINEISFTSWGLSVHMFRCLNMDHEHPGHHGKRQLVRATIAGCDAIWQVHPQARILQCDPLIHVIAPPDNPAWDNSAHVWREAQFEAWDMLCGRIEPELGGAERYLDLIGLNYYHSNQWESGSNLRLWWHLGDARRLPLHVLQKEVFERYQRPLLLAETSHVGSGRGVWIREMAEQAALAMQHGTDLRGICIYPVIDRPDWEDPNFWHHSGLWDVGLGAPDGLQRNLSAPYAMGLRQAQSLTAHLCSLYAPSGRGGAGMRTIIVFSHLRWNFVYQRPQQLLSRLAQFYHVVFVEEPLFDEGPARLELSTPAPNVTVCLPRTPVQAAGFHDDQLAALQPLLLQITPALDPIVWFYTPMALPLLPGLHAGLVVYDCMDELSAFKNAPKQVLQRETALLARADLVFAGGPSLYEAKRTRHTNAHCFSSSVDVVHFEQALDRNNHHPAQQDIGRPRLGYYGVIDERFDASLIAALADAHSHWQIVVVGPVLKIDPASLPQRQNIHYLGQQPYQSLPHFLAGWDVCLLPFARNDATRFISPTKVLEYMAAQLPIVSTSIADVAAPYGHIVRIADEAADFVRACEEALAMTPPQRAAMVADMALVLAATSWDRTARQMHALLEATDPAQPLLIEPADSLAPNDTAALDTPANVNPLRSQAAMLPVQCAIIGAGPTGLSAAYHLGADTLLLEKNATVGGWCRSVRDQGFTFDYAGHIMFSNDAYVLNLYRVLLGANIHWQNREAWVYSKQVYTRYPFQGALFGLPPAVIKECIVGAMQARYGHAAPAANQASACVTPVEDCCADGTAGIANGAAGGGIGSIAPLKRDAANFEEFIYQVWGAGIAKHFAIPYNKKLWTVPLSDMETSWLGGRVPLPDLEEIIDGALQPVARPMGPNARFAYPLQGGFQSLMNGFLPHIKGQLEVNADVVQLLPDQHVLALADGRRFRYQHLISTMPLPELIRLIGEQAPLDVRLAARGLRHVSVRCVNLGIGREDVTEKHWVYYPEQTIFHRIFVQGNASPDCNPPGGFGLTCEISYSPTKPLPLTGQALIDRCVADCIEVGMLRPDDVVLTANQVDMPYAYVLYDHARASNVALVKAWLARHDITLAGRYSEWEYYNSDHAFIAGKKAAQAVMAQVAGVSRNAVAE
ncbi:NAD(P)-binding protein [Janthinobacterium agaricidamnosum]|uniref:Flavin containing amine oxidoreductase family protein n=1 Tax=Janthinobacterium agaricidamnosum NBRC 102515 = DSM 9628 TaxID=1349767 RepID=W0VB37_9BURK|nr:NAD(P)-binding protein [Janthinobacterium agaricidamnosum]CDG84840.1 flavin containing amine oxidoreductase family protein [Janthinobacterium agaricidamnosum NBRC 102515 = DSM 9628]